MTPCRTFIQLSHAFLSMLPRVRDGNPEAIHDARVATRRLRSMILMMGLSGADRDWERVERLLKKAARALGRARDTDVALDLSLELERRAPSFAPLLGKLRGDLLKRQLDGRRKLIRTLDGLSFRPLVEVSRGGSRFVRWPFAVDSLRALPAAVTGQALAVEHAIQHASGVYFGGRTHATRVEIKKLRYLLELSEPCESRRKWLKLLRSSQRALGDIHDREVLLRRLRRLRLPDRDPSAGPDALAALLEAEIRSLFENYADDRVKVSTLCAVVRAWAAAIRTSRLRRRMVTAGVAALPPAALVLARVSRS